ncbi:zinc metalloproteinase nas-7-like isoform X1 [Nasonia vitripennis]|uniref:Metalloendopeptidase n=2 Tax=Nasonia vitripennis TaxID=7425 RepID=A0A7M7GBY7_NASVI|nr:zinc metalloproteinase nas-7-like isoform X1 [Nasonia vitripennis]
MKAKKVLLRGMIMQIVIVIILYHKYIQSLDHQNYPNRVFDPHDRLEIEKRVLAKMKKRWDVYNLQNVKFGRDRDFLWPYGIVPYTFEKSYPLEWAMIFEKTVRYVKRTTCIRYRRRRPQDQDYIEVAHLNTTAACNRGITGYFRGRTFLYLQSHCIHDRGLTLHMMMIVLGFYDQHNLHNRDDYINIHWDNVIPEAKAYLYKYRPEDSTDFGLPYDYHSVMQLYDWVYANKENVTTFSPKIKGVTLGPRNKFSPDDIMKINTLYEWECAAREYKESLSKEPL